jgi:hypothetical protein
MTQFFANLPRLFASTRYKLRECTLFSGRFAIQDGKYCQWLHCFVLRARRDHARSSKRQ